MLEINGFGCIEQIQFPDDWSKDPDQTTGLMHLTTLHPPRHADIEISLFQKTQGVSNESMKDFREVLGKSVHKIIEGTDELIQLSSVLGNAGNNQWANKNKGVAGPTFRFTSGETKQINGRIVLQILGTFIEPETKKPINQHCGIFIDGGTERNLVQEIFLQVPSQHGYFQFEQYIKVFGQTLSSIKWK